MTFAIVVAALLAAAISIIITIIKNMYVCAPNEVLIFSGRRWPLPGDEEGRTVGFRIVRGGRAIRVPLIEVVDRMALNNMAIELSVANAFSKGGIPLNVQAVANIKIPSEEPLLHNALERFLGFSQEQIIFVAKDTLEGNLRGVIAELTPEEINQKKTVFQQKLLEEAHRDMQRLGLVLDNLQIQNISDDVGYLTSVGRVRGAQVRKSARIGELKAQSSASVQRANNQMESEIAKIDADIQVAQKETERRINEAKTQRKAAISEVRGQVAAQIAEAGAQLRAWDARVEQVRRRLEADVVAPANASKLQAEQGAKALAAKTLEQGKASADALASLAAAYQTAGPRARDALLLQKLMPVFQTLTGTLNAVRIDRFTVIGGDGGANNSAAQALIRANEQVRSATGVDLVGTAQRLAGTPPPPRN